MWKFILFLGAMVNCVYGSSPEQVPWANDSIITYGTNYTVQEPDDGDLATSKSWCKRCCLDCLERGKKKACDGDLPGCAGKKSKVEAWCIGGFMSVLAVTTYFCLQKLKHVNDNDDG